MKLNILQYYKKKMIWWICVKIFFNDVVCRRRHQSKYLILNNRWTMHWEANGIQCPFGVKYFYLRFGTFVPSKSNHRLQLTANSLTWSTCWSWFVHIIDPSSVVDSLPKSMLKLWAVLRAVLFNYFPVWSSKHFYNF